MSFLTKGVRKVSNWMSSSPPTALLGKRKADWEDEESDSSLDYDSDSIKSDDERLPPEDYDTDSSGSSDERPAVKEVACFSVDGKKSQPFGHRAGTSRAVTRSRNDSFLKNNATLRKIDQEYAIQQEIEEKTRQEHDGIFESQKKRVTPGETKDASVTRRVTFERSAGTSRPKAKPAVKPSSPKVPARRESANISKSTTVKAQWADKPNTRAREILKKELYAPAALLDDLKEPEYAFRDVEIRDGVWQMMDQIEAFAKEHFSFELKDKTRLRAAFEKMPKETVNIIGCVASGGPAGASGWEDLFLDSDKRQALVCAIVGNVIVEQVFQHMFFGGTEEQIKAVSHIQYTHRNHDGFDRNHLYATKIRSFLAPSSDKGKATANRTPSLHLPPNFNDHTNHITAALLTHLKPILSLHHLTAAPQYQALSTLIPSLHPITVHSGLLSLSMRLDAHTAYHLTPAFKEQPFTASSMTCVNHLAMISTHPRGTGDKDLISPTEQARRATLSEEELNRMHHDQGLVQITLFPELTAYRLGGWETARSGARACKPRSGTEKVEFEPGCSGAGVRVRPLTDAWVYCRWGRPRVWQDGRPADERETHRVAWRGGFVEFFPGVEGVEDPDPERTARVEARKLDVEKFEAKKREEEKEKQREKDNKGRNIEAVELIESGEDEDDT